MAYTMPDPDRSHTARYITIAVIIVVVVALLFPLFSVLSAVGYLGEKTYLVVLQDNSEIRGTGGLMSLMGVLTLNNGHIEHVQYYYSHNSNSSNPLQSTVSLDGPASFTSYFGVNAATLFDSNTQYDFATFAPKVQSDWQSITGQKVDGVIGLDFTAAKAILKVLGPVTVSGETITDRNVFDRLEYYSATSKGNQMASLLSTLTYGTLGLVLGASVPQKLELYNTLRDMSNQKHFFIYPDPGLFPGGSSSATRAPQADSIAVNDMNFGNGKSDFGIKRSLNYHVELLPNGSTVSRLTVTYANGDWWPSDLFSQAIVPAGAQLIGVQNTTANFAGTKVTSGSDHTVFASRFIVAPYSTASLTYYYTLPNRAYGNGIGSHYDLYVGKQGGIDRYTLNATVQLPQGATLIHSENIGSPLVLTGDAHASVIYT